VAKEKIGERRVCVPNLIWGAGEDKVRGFLCFGRGGLLERVDEEKVNIVGELYMRSISQEVKEKHREGKNNFNLPVVVFKAVVSVASGKSEIGAVECSQGESSLVESSSIESSDKSLATLPKHYFRR